MCKGWWRWALVSPDGVASSRMVGVSASVNLPLHQSISSLLAPAHPGGPGKRAVKRLCGLWWWCKDLSFHKESRDLTAPPAAPSLARISLLQSPFSVIIAPRYLNVSTCSSSLPWHIIAICSFCGVMVVTFVFFVFISSPYSLHLI